MGNESSACVKLEPCPFCGSSATAMKDGGHWWIECDNCGVATPTENFTQHTVHANPDGLWNTRVRADSPTPEYHALLEAEHALSAAYVRLRSKIGMAAFNTPDAPTPEQVWKQTELALDLMIEGYQTEVKCLREALKDARADSPRPAGGDAPESVVTEVQRRMDAVVDAAVEWHQSDADWMEKSDALETAIDSLLELRESPKPQSRIVTPAASFQPPDSCPECQAGVPFDEHGGHKQ